VRTVRDLNKLSGFFKLSIVMIIPVCLLSVYASLLSVRSWPAVPDISVAMLTYQITVSLETRFNTP
jgi:hypothetical protein